LKRSRLLVVIISFSIFLTFFNSVGYAIINDDLIVSVLLSNQTLYQGRNVTANIFLINNSTEEIIIQYAGLHFDWMQIDQFLGLNLINDPITIPSNETHTFDSITIFVPEDVITGQHDYWVGIDGLDDQSNVFNWDSQTLHIIIQNSEIIESYNQYLIQTSNKIAEVNKNKYRSPKAQSLLEQSEDTYLQAISLANQENWVEANSAIQTVVDLLDQAELEEQKYMSENSLQNQLLLIIGVSVVVILVIVIFFKRVRKNNQNSKPTQPLDFDI
jgi:hypothetical protein